MKSRKLLRRNVVTIERRTPRDSPVARMRKVPVILSIIESSARVGAAAVDVSQSGLPLAGSTSIEKRASEVPATLRQRRLAPGVGWLTGFGWPFGPGAVSHVFQ